MTNDTSRCGNIDCTMKEKCKRFTQLKKDVEEKKGGVYSVTMFKPINENQCLFKIV